MYHCFVCDKFEPSISQFRAHLLWHYNLAELKLPILCRQGSCRASFSKLYNFIRHVNSYHASGDNSMLHEISHNIVETVVCISDDNDRDCDVGTVGNGSDGTDQFNDESEKCLSKIRTEAIALVTSLRANSSIPYSIIPSIVESIKHINLSTTSCVQNIAEASLLVAGIEKLLC